MSLSARERETALALAEAVLPPGRVLPGAGEGSLLRLERLLAELPPTFQRGYARLLGALELAAFARRGARFGALPLGHRLELLDAWAGAEASRLALRGLTTLVKLAYFDDPAVYAALGCRFEVERPRAIERPRWRAQLVAAGSLSDGETLECDVVVVGSGAGGAPMAYALARRGLAVILVEEGEHHGREELNGRPLEMMKRLYRKSGATVAFGNTAIPIPIGRGVGGTTLVNSGTCFRVPDATLREWRERYGIDELALDPYYAEVEEVLGVGPSNKQALGRQAELIARGCDALGYSHHPLLRNAPGCDGQGLCCFGCPTEAKRSTNVSFVPMALERGAQLLTGLAIDRVLTEGARAIGVSGLAGARRVTVRSHAVVLSCGAFHTPALLARNGLCDNSGMLGKNLSIHPASAAIGRFDEEVNSAKSVPQGYAIDEFKSEGILFEGGSTPLELTGAALTGYGPAYVSLMEDFNRTVQFGFMVKDSSRGVVKTGPDGEPRIRYSLNDADLAKMVRGMGILSRVLFAAGATEVYPAVAGFERLRSVADVERLERASLSARHIDITAYHPLGTARMGKDPLQSVVDPSHETWDVHGLFIADGSAVPGSLGVNPQLTIMAMALRAAEHVARRAERLSRAA